MRVKTAVVLLLVGVLVPTAARAQTQNRFALGAQISKRASTGPEAHGHLGVGLLWRFGHSRTGFGWDWGLNWFAADVDRSINGTETELGKLYVRPVMGGYGYTHVVGRTALSAKVLAGYAFSSATLADSGSAAYRDRLGAQAITIDASNTFVMKPELSMWRDLSEKLGLRASVGYMVARPHITVASTVGKDKQRVNADMLMFKVGVVYSIF